MLTDDRPTNAAVPDGEPGIRGTADRRTATGIALVVVVFLIDAWPRIAAAFGDSHDGRNAAVWTLGADSLVEHGLITSRLGAWAEVRGTYANHPPLIYPLTALGRLVSDHPAAAKAPAWLASVLAIVLLVRLLRKGGASEAAALASTLLVVGTPMFLVFGGMLNMEALSLPAMLGLLLAWQEPVWPSVRRTAAVAGLGALISWQGVVLGGLLGIVALYRCRRDRRRPLPHEWGTLVGTAVGTSLTFAWLWWANRGLGAVLSQGRTRSSARAFTLPEFVDQQLDYLFSTVPLWIVVAAAIGSWLTLRQGVPLTFVVSSAVVVLFALGFSHGAMNHVYWNYLVLVPLALGVAPALDALRRRFGAQGGAVVLALGGVALLIGCVLQTPMHEEIDEGLEVLATAQADPFGGPTTRYACTIGTSGWLAWATGRPVAALDGGELEDLARTDPAAGVYVASWAVPRTEDTWDDVLERAVVAGTTSAWVTAADLVAVIGPDAYPPGVCS